MSGMKGNKMLPVLALGVAGWAAGMPAAARVKPHVILIMTDQQRWDDRVGQGHYCPLPPSEPYVRVSPHTAQAFQSLCSCAETGSSYFLFPLFLRDNLKHSS